MNRLPLRTIATALGICVSAHISVAGASSNSPFEENFGEERLEQRSPSGQVPASAWAPPPSTVEPAEQRYITAPESSSGEDATEVVTARFNSAYRAAGSPRIAVYFNRELSEEVREWVPGYQQLRVTSSQTASAIGPGLLTADASLSTDHTATLRTRHYADASGGRVDPSEAWKWQFEDAITSVFLGAGANVVDRALIFRQTARKQPQGQDQDGISVTLNEMSALNTFADILVEVKVTRSYSTLGYDFRATGKNIKTGQIIATAFLDGEGSEREKHFVATANGYEKQYKTLLTVDYISRELTLKLMQSMAPQLSR